ncbi:MAG: type II secretion system F family protein [Tepidisphaeraceae bacterium]
MAQRLIPLLVFLVVLTLGSAVLVFRGWRRRVLKQRLYGNDSASPFSGGGSAGGSGQFYGGSAAAVPSGGFVSTVEQIGRAVSAGKPEAGLREWLAQAGYYEDAAPTVYVGAQLVLGLLALIIGGATAFSFELPLMLRGCIVVAFLAAFALLPNILVTIRRRKRTADVRSHLPDAIDLLEICVSSGMGLDMAWNAVCDEFRGVSSILADEMALSNLEMHLGAPRADAMRNMAKRTGVEDISSLVATLVQSERFGTSVSQALRTYADAMRAERSQRAEEAAEKLAVLLLFPMVMFIFPCMFIVILGPAGVKIREMFIGA